MSLIQKGGFQETDVKWVVHKFPDFCSYKTERKIYQVSDSKGQVPMNWGNWVQNCSQSTPSYQLTSVHSFTC